MWNDNGRNWNYNLLRQFWKGAAAASIARPVGRRLRHFI
jgi:hypothetical protein